ncbi:MAG: FAD-dependent oxidoreductase [Synergistaceae bacterium]|jgi:protoporphyrinogen oxidase|nr:FAD-dependent oxidoreductase [Synergistaceae bacterium]
MKRYDVIIAGGGLAGLSAACGLDGKRVLLLEADARLGGKVRTESRNGIVYEAGAIFAFDPAWFAFPVDAGSRWDNDNPIGLFLKGRLHTGESVAECLRSLSAETRQQICVPFFLASPNPREEMIGEDLAAGLRAFFRVIHPGTPEEAVPARRRDCLVRHRADRFERGNGAMIDALAAHCGAEIRTDARVLGLEPNGQGVKVLWSGANGSREEAFAAKVILAVPASAAKELCGASGNVSRDFLGRVRYGGGIAVMLHCRAENRRPLSYMVSPEGNFNTFIFHQIPAAPVPVAPDEVVVTGYIVGERAAACRDMDDAELTRMMTEELQAAGIGEFDAAKCSLLESRPWPEVAPIIEESAYRGFSAAWLHPMPGVILAGDYTWWDWAMLPYGMKQAIESGRRAARLCSEPDFVPISTDFGRKPLAETTVIRLKDAGPEYAETFRDGTVAYYGLLLQAACAGYGGFRIHDGERLEMERYLLNESVGGLWGYQRDYGATSLDSALVMEGLLSAGGHDRILRESCRALVDKFFDREEGGFRTIAAGLPGRAPYWRGTDCPATGYCAWLLTQIDPEGYAEEITLCRDYLLRRQRVSGGWPGKWFPSQTIPILYALRFLASLCGAAQDSPLLAAAAAERAVLRLLSGQGRDGSWSGSVIETSAALLALEAVSPGSPSAASGRDWLLGARGPDGWAGEPILDYWFEENGERALFFTRDLGRVTSAWAALALACAEKK